MFNIVGFINFFNLMQGFQLTLFETASYTCTCNNLKKGFLFNIHNVIEYAIIIFFNLFMTTKYTKVI